MKRFFPFLALLFFSCGGGMGEESVVTTETTGGILQQDVVCCSYWDSNTNSCLDYATPQPVAYKFKLSFSDSTEFGSQSYSYAGCKVELVPLSDVPSELQDPQTLDTYASWITCSAADLSPEGEAEGLVALSSRLVDEMRTYVSLYGKTLLYRL